MPRFPRVLPSRFACSILCFALSAPALADTRVWPVLIGPGCNGTLQQCIDGAADGDTVRIVNDDLLVPNGYTAIGEDILIEKSLTLEAAPGVDAVFAPGRSLRVNSPTVGTVAVTLRRLVIRAGRIAVLHRNFGPGTYTLDQVRVDESIEGLGSCAVELEDRGEGQATFVMGDSDLRFTTPAPAGLTALCVSGNGGPWQVSLFRNRIESVAGALFGGIGFVGSSAGNVSVSSNQLFLYGAPRGLSVSQSPGTAANVLSIRDNLITGQRSAPASTEAALLVTPRNADLRIVNNTLARNRNAMFVGYVDGHGSSGRVANNIAAYNRTGLGIDTRHTTIAASHNLQFANEIPSLVTSPSSLEADPQFVGMHDFRLRVSSPARNAGNNADVLTVLGTAFDGDGERRLVNGTVDLGAFEWNGDQSIRHHAEVENAIANYTGLTGLQALSPGANVVVTPLRGPVTGAELQETLGVYQQNAGSTADFFAFHEDFAVDLSPGRRLHAFAPLFGTTGFLHTTTLASVVDAYSRVSHPELDSRPGAIAFVTHNWNPGGSGGLYHDHRLGLDYVAPNWFVGNQDSASMPSGRGFNIVVAPVGSPNAFVQAVGASPRREVRLEHPLLDDNECATFQVGRNGTTFNDTAYSVEYRAGAGGAPGHWFIVAEGAGSPTFPADAAFNVMVSGAQANACQVTPLFANGFE